MLPGEMLGNAVGSCSIVALTARKRYAYGKSGRSLITER